MLDTRIPAYVLGGHQAGLAVVRSLARAGIDVVAVLSRPGELAYRSRLPKARELGPDPADEPDAFAEFLVALGARHGRGVLFPSTDESLEAVSAHRARLDDAHIVACPSPWSAERFLDKRMTAEVADKVEVEAPRTAAPGTEEELAECEGDLRYPCLIKPRESYRYTRMFHTKMHRVENREQMWAAWRRADAENIGVLVQEIIPGPETAGVNYNVYVVDGEPRVEFTSRKLRLNPPNFGFPSAVRTEHIDEIIEPGRRMVRGMAIEGFANVEFKRDERDGRYKLMEVNGRPNMSGALAVHCGVDFPQMTYRHLVDGITPTPLPWRDGVHWINDKVDRNAVLARWRRRELGVGPGLTPYVSRHVRSTFAADDPGPALARLRGLGRAYRALDDRRSR